MAKVMFSYRVYCDDPKIRSVIVCHGELKEEQSYPCTDGAAYIQLYTPDARILFEDEKRRRYATTVDYNIQKLMDEKPYLQSCMNLDIATPGLLLAVCGNVRIPRAIPPYGMQKNSGILCRTRRR